jgi:hypothetical protein
LPWAIIASGQVEPLTLPARSPNLNACAERWVRSVKEEGLSKVIHFGERSLRRTLNEYVDHYLPSATIKARATSCSSLGTGTSIVGGPSNVASDWADSCAITIKRRRERVQHEFFDLTGTENGGSWPDSDPPGRPERVRLLGCGHL